MEKEETPGTSVSATSREVYSSPMPVSSSSPNILAPTTDIRDSRCCFHFTKYETFIYVVGIFGVIISVAKIAVIGYYSKHLYNHKEYSVTSTYYLCGIGICLSAIILIWEIPMMCFVRTRKLTGLQQWMFAMMLHFLGSCLGAIITGGIFKIPGLFLSLSFVVDMVRIPPQMLLVHKFIKSEKLNEDSHYTAAYYKKF